MTRRALQALAAAAGLALTTACGAAAAASSQSPTSVSASGNGFETRLDLDQTTVKAGTQIHGKLTVTNATASAVPLDCNTWYLAGLTTASISFDDAISGVGCGITRSIPVGTTTYPVTIISSYHGCTMQNPGARGTADRPMCIPGESPGVPNLPAGKYQTRVDFLQAATTLPRPLPITVTLTN